VTVTCAWCGKEIDELAARVFPCGVVVSYLHVDSIVVGPSVRPILSWLTCDAQCATNLIGSIVVFVNGIQGSKWRIQDCNNNNVSTLQLNVKTVCTIEQESCAEPQDERVKC